MQGRWGRTGQWEGERARGTQYAWESKRALGSSKKTAHKHVCGLGSLQWGMYSPGVGRAQVRTELLHFVV